MPRASSARKATNDCNRGRKRAGNPDRHALVASDCCEPREGRFDCLGLGRRIEDNVGARGRKGLTGRERHGAALRGRPVIDVK